MPPTPWVKPLRAASARAAASAVGEVGLPDDAGERPRQPPAAARRRRVPGADVDGEAGEAHQGHEHERGEDDGVAAFFDATRYRRKTL